MKGAKNVNCTKQKQKKIKLNKTQIYDFIISFKLFY